MPARIVMYLSITPGNHPGPFFVTSPHESGSARSAAIEVDGDEFLIMIAG